MGGMCRTNWHMLCMLPLDSIGQKQTIKWGIEKPAAETRRDSEPRQYTTGYGAAWRMGPGF